MKQGPDYIQLYPTLRCNRSCDFCFNRSLPDAGDMSCADFRSMLGALARVSVRTIDILGGEPTLHPDIVAFVRDALDSGFLVNISSNGSNLDVLEELAGMGPRVTIGISINDRETLTQTGAFIQARSVVVKSLFHPDMDRGIIRDILSLKPKKYYLIYRDALHRSALAATVPFPQFIEEVERQFAPEQTDTVFCSGFVPDQEGPAELARVRCPAGTTKLGVLPDGSVYPCNLFFGQKEFLLGNLLNGTFSDIWQHWTLAYFRGPVQNPCARTSCRMHARCHGGCPAHSFALANDLAAPDPRCGGA